MNSIQILEPQRGDALREWDAASPIQGSLLLVVEGRLPRVSLRYTLGYDNGAPVGGFCEPEEDTAAYTWRLS